MKIKNSIISKIYNGTKLGYPLDPEYDVHHIDGNYYNNDFDNLELIKHGEHQSIHSSYKKYSNKFIKCDVCGKYFIWTAQSQKYHFSNQKRKHGISKICCSRQCAGKAGSQRAVI